MIPIFIRSGLIVSIVVILNAFNSMLKIIIFQKLHAIRGDIIKFIPFVRAFYAFEFPLFYNHHNCEGEVTIIPSTMGTH